MFKFSRNAARYFAAAAATLFLISCGGSDDTPAPPPFASTVVVIGASGADIGNRCGSADPLCFPVPPYSGTSTAANGKLYPQLVAERYGAPLVTSSLGGTNFAIGGATTGVIPTDTVAQKLPNMQVQLEQYLQRNAFNIKNFHIDGNKNGLAFAMDKSASLYVVINNPELAARLIGWSDATRKEIGDPRPRIEQADLDQDIALIRAKIGANAYEAAYDTGRDLTLDDAVAFASGDK